MKAASPGILEAGLKHGIKLRKSRSDSTGDRSPNAIFQRGDGESKFEFQSFFGMEIAAAVAPHDFELAVDGFYGVGG